MIHNNSVQMQEVYWGLKDNWWKQIYDGKVHKFGPDVFDKGLHKGNIEPGYYQSVKNACEFASQEIGKPLTVEVYNKIHSIACEHFGKVDRHEINVDKENIDKYRANHSRCKTDITVNLKSNDEIKNKTNKISFYLLKNYIRDIYYAYRIDITGTKKEELQNIKSDIKEKYIDKYSDYAEDGVNVKDTIENGCPFIYEALETIRLVENQLKETQIKLGLAKPFANLRLIELDIHCDYNYSDPVEISKIVVNLIDDYNKKISSIPSDFTQRTDEQNELALSYIAEFFQNLEWLHPFYDGQGRTDLVLLTKLLTENGFNPAILYHPYISTHEPLAKWISYLKDGMNDWKKEFREIHSL